MNISKVLGGVACLSVLLGTGAWAEMVGGEPGTSTNPTENVPAEIQRSTPSGEDFGKGGSGPGERSDALSGMNEEKPLATTEQGLEQNAEKTDEGGAAVAAEELKEKGEQSQKDIAAQSSHKNMKKKLPKKALQQDDPPVKE